MKNQITKTSKFLSYVLRHQPDSIGLSLDENGWADIDQLISCAAANGKNISRDLLEEVVTTNDKQRFIFSDDKQRIRANQGHSIKVDLNLASQTPPDVLYHGTASRFMHTINQQGLQARNRHHVHLSAEQATAFSVGTRHGVPVVLNIDAKRMHADGLLFYQADNGVWLTDAVLPKYFSVLQSS